jgi:hypothetical protein
LLTDLRTVDNANTLRGQFAIGELVGFHVRDDGRLDEISQSEWIAESGEIMMGCGRYVERTDRGWSPKGYIVVAIPKKVAVMPAEATETRGRKGYDWESFWIEVVRIVNKSPDGLPEKQAEFEITMLEWCEKTWGKEVGESTVRERLSRVYAAIRKGQK